MDGEFALVTGAGRGQGRAHATELSGHGADIVAPDHPEQALVAYQMVTEPDLETSCSARSSSGLPGAVEARLCAEDPAKEFRPTPVPIYAYSHPDRLDFAPRKGWTQRGDPPVPPRRCLLKVVAPAGTRGGQLPCWRPPPRPWARGSGCPGVAGARGAQFLPVNHTDIPTALLP